MSKETSTLTAIQKLQTAKVQLQNSGIKKSGRNEHAKYSYFDLSDIQPQINKIFLDLGLYDHFEITQQIVDGVVYETAKLDIYNLDQPSDVISFSSPTADHTMGSPIQQLGARHTYMRRYLYLEALCIAETDVVESTTGLDTPTPAPANIKPATEAQIKILTDFCTKNPERGTALLDYFKVTSLKELNIKQASDAIANITKKGGQANV